MSKIIQWVVLLIVVLALLVPPVLGQATGRGEVRGVVRDQNRAVVPGADVSIVNQSTNFTQETITSEVGAYFMGAVPVGSYSLKVEMPGFNTWTTDFVMQAGATVTIDAELQVGDISTTIEVTDSVSEVSIDRLEISDVKDFDRIQQLPLNGREVGTLFSLTPGVEGEGGTTRVLGQKHGSLEITLDGVSMIDRNGGGLRGGVVPRVDLIQEFRVETVGSDARFANPSTVTMVSRSGTNEIHGSVFYTHRNNTGGLRARRRNEYGDPSKYLRHEWGATVGGPLWLGKLYDGRDKTFWFFNYEGMRAYQTRYFGGTVPLDNWWDGDFSNLIDGNQVPITIYNPYTSRPDGTREAFPNNQIPSNMIHPFRDTMERISAKPNLPTNPALGNNFEYYYPVVEPTLNLTWKGDQVLSEKDNLSVRYSYLSNSRQDFGGRYASPPPELAVSEPGCCGGSSLREQRMHNVSVNWNRTMSAQLLNEFLVGVNRVYHHRGTLSDFDEWGTKLGLPNPFNAPGWPTFSAGYGVWDADNLITQPQTHVSGEDNLTWVKGDHVLQFGGKVKIAHTNNAQFQQAQGSHSFDQNWTALWDPSGQQRVSRTGDGLAAAMLGLGSYFSAQLNRGFFYYRQNEFNAYVNDKWKVSPRMTVNLGLRWDSWTPYREKLGRSVMIDKQSFFDPVFQVVTPTGTRMEDMPGLPEGLRQGWANRGLTWKTADQVPGMPDTLWAADWNNFGPRLGISYMLTNKTVLRGSYGEYFWTMPLEQLLASARSLPPLNNRYRYYASQVDESGTYNLRATPQASDVLENIVIETEGVVTIPQSTLGYQMQQDGRDWRDAKARTWHLTLEHEIMRNTALRFSYTGTQGRDFEQKYNNNNPEQEFNWVTKTGEVYPSGTAVNQLRANPDWDGRMAVNRTGYSNSHAGQIEIERRFSDGIGFQAFYIYNHTLITADAGGFSHGGGNINDVGGTAQYPSFVNLYQVPNPVGPYFTSSPSEEELRKLVYLNSYNVPPHRLSFNGIVDLPFGRGKRFGEDVSGAVNQVVGGWQVAFIGNWRSGYWRSISTGKGVFGDYLIDPGDRPTIKIFNKDQIVWFAGDFESSSCQSNCEGLSSLVNPDRSQRVVRPYGPNFDNRIPITLNNGNVRNTAVLGTYVFWPFSKNNWMGPRNWNVDLSIFKHFYLTEDVNLRFTADFFNFFNHPNNNDPNTSTGLVDLTSQSNEPRTIQFSLALRW